MTENIILFPYTYVKDTKNNSGIQILLPYVHVKGTWGSRFFVYIFGKGEKGRGRLMEGLDTTLSHTTYWQNNIPPTFRRFSFGDDHLWRFAFPMLIFVPHIWQFPSAIFIVDFHLWRVPLMIIFLVVYTFILLDLHWQLTLQFQV